MASRRDSQFMPLRGVRPIAQSLPSRAGRPPHPRSTSLPPSHLDIGSRYPLCPLPSEIHSRPLPSPKTIPRHRFRSSDSIRDAARQQSFDSQQRSSSLERGRRRVSSQVGSPLRDCITAKSQDVPPPVPEKPSPRSNPGASPASTASSSPLSSLSGILPLPPSLTTPEGEAPPPPPPKDILPVPPPKPLRRQTRSSSQPRSSSREGLNTSPWNSPQQHQLTSKPSHSSELRLHRHVPSKLNLEKDYRVIGSQPLVSPAMTRTVLGTGTSYSGRPPIWNLDAQLSPAEGSALVLSPNESTSSKTTSPIMASFTLSSSRSRSDAVPGNHHFKLSTVFSKRSRPTPNTLVSEGRFNAAFLPPPIPVYANRQY